MTNFRNRAAFWLTTTALIAGLWLVNVVTNEATFAVAAESATPEAGQALLEKLRSLRPDMPIESVSASPVPGIFQLQLSGGTIFYGTADARYLFAGDLYELGDTDLINLAEAGRSEKRRQLLAAVSLEDMFVFSPVGATKAVISVFTDVDCGYCRKLHAEVGQLNELGIEVRYLAYPRAGIGSDSYDKIVTAWCSVDRNKAITKLKLGENLPMRDCANPVARQYDLGGEIGVTGTPAIVTEDGRMLPGYMPAQQLAKTIGI